MRGSAGSVASTSRPAPPVLGDSFRAGFLAAVAAGLSLERAAQVGCTIAASVVETKGTQEYHLGRGAFETRFGSAYGEEAAAEVVAALKLRVQHRAT